MTKHDPFLGEDAAEFSVFRLSILVVVAIFVRVWEYIVKLMRRKHKE